MIKVWTTSLLLTSTVLSSEFIENPEPHHFPRHLMVPYVMTQQESRDLVWVQQRGTIFIPHLTSYSIGVAQGLLNIRNQDTLNYLFESYASKGYEEPLKWILSEACPLKPNQYTFNRAFEKVVKDNNLPMVKWYFSESCLLKPDQDSVNLALSGEAEHNYFPLVQWILSEACPLKPNQYTFNRAFEKVVKDNNLPMVKWYFSESCLLKPDQFCFKNAFTEAAKDNNLPMVEWFFSEDCTIKPNQESVNKAFVEVAKDNNLPMVKWFLSDACPMKPNEYNLNRVFSEAASRNDQPMVEWFLSDSCPMKRGQRGVDEAFIYAIKPNCIPMLKWFLSDACPTKPSNHPWERTINKAFVEAVNFNHQSVAEWIFSDDCPIKPDQRGVNESISNLHQQIPLLQWILSDAFPIKPNQDSVNYSFSNAAQFGTQPLVECFFDESCFMKPNQEGVNKALLDAGIRRESSDMMIYLLDPQRSIRPDVDALCSVYRNLQNGHLSEITTQVRRHLILNHLPQEHRQRLLAEHAQGNACGQGRGVAFEIHDYANIVFDEAMSHVSSLLHDESLPSAQEVQALLLQKGSDLFNSSEQSKVVEAILIALSPEYMETLSKVLHFVQSHHGDKIDLWIHSFIGDSITAYNSLRTLSCHKGVKERIVTGLRTLGDENLNRIFAKAEARLLIANKFSLFNLGDESMKAACIEDLKSLGVTADTSGDELSQRIREMVHHKFEGDTLTESETQTVEETISHMIDVMHTDRALFNS